MAGSAGITLNYPATGDVTHSVELPWPAHDQAGQITTNQSLHRTPSGLDYEVDHGPPYGCITRTFEALTAEQVSALYAFWQAIGRAAGAIAYSYVDSTGTTQNETSWLLDPPEEKKVMRDMYDVTLAFYTDRIAGETDTLGSGTLGPAITSPLYEVGTTGEAFSYAITADGDLPITFAISSGLPGTLTFDGTATISGTWPAPGSYSLVLSATNDGGTSTATLTLAVLGGDGPPTITSPLSVAVTTSVPFSYVITASGVATITFDVTSLPGWATFDGTATISGTPPADDTYTIDLSATNGLGTDSETLTIVSSAEVGGTPPEITCSLGVLGIPGDVFNFPLTATGEGPITWTADTTTAGFPTGAGLGINIVGSNYYLTAASGNLPLTTYATVPYVIPVTATGPGGSATVDLQVMIAQSFTNTPVSIAQISDGVDDPAWTNPDNALVADGSFATITLDHGDAATVLFGVEFSNGSTLPSGATIVGFKLHLKGLQSPVFPTDDFAVEAHTYKSGSEVDFFVGSPPMIWDAAAFLGTSNAAAESIYLAFAGYGVNAFPSVPILVNSSYAPWNPMLTNEGIGFRLVNNTPSELPTDPSYDISIDSIALEIFYVFIP